MQFLKSSEIFKVDFLALFVFMDSISFAQTTYTAENEGWLVDVNEAYEISQ